MMFFCFAQLTLSNALMIKHYTQPGNLSMKFYSKYRKLRTNVPVYLTINWSLSLTNAIYGAAITDEVSFKIENETIKKVLQEKVFGIAIHNKPTLEPHVENFCKKAREKPHVLSKIANYKCMQTKREVLCVHQ